MKSLFSRFKNSSSSSAQNSSSRPPSSNSIRDKDRDIDQFSRRPSIRKKTNSTTSSISNPISPIHSSLPTNTPTPVSSSTDTTTTNSSVTTSSQNRPHSYAGYLEDAAILVDSTPPWEEQQSGRRGRTLSNGEIKKVTFRSPIPTPTTSLVLDNMIIQNTNELYDDEETQDQFQEELLMSTENDRLSSIPIPITIPSPTKKSTSFFHKRPNLQSRSSTSQSNSRPPTLRKASLPPVSHSNSPEKTMLSPTISETSLGGRSYLPPPNSWSEMAEDDLINNLGPKERTRQEVLWEIVSSEERYVNDLVKLNETFCKNLLPASAQSPSLDLYDPNHTLTDTLSRTLSPSQHSSSNPGSPDTANLPIAAKYASSSSYSTGLNEALRSGQCTPINGDTLDSRPSSRNDARRNAYHILTNGRPSQLPSHKASLSTLDKGRAHHSLPPLSKHTQHPSTQASFSASYARMSLQPKLAKGEKRTSNSSVMTTREVQLPEDLEKVLSVLSGGILEGHLKLVAALKRRYDSQYPLVRSLADVFTAHSAILREYATYVLHLERALAIINESLSLLPASATTTSSTMKTKRLSKKLDESPSLRLSYILHQLENLAAERGESGLVISLSKPFSRLCKYPLLFQNLLFNTDPSLKEYEATLAMVDEMDTIVRTIEDEKIGSEERTKTRDVWARIEGIEKDQMLMTPKSNRLLIDETQLPRVEDAADTDTKRKKSFKRLSDILTRGEHQDLWVVRFSDVTILCEKLGSTSLPIYQRETTRSDSANDLGGNHPIEQHRSRKHGNISRRAQSIKTRNLYRFVRIYEWNLQQNNGSREGLLDMGEISRSRESSHQRTNGDIQEETSVKPSSPIVISQIPLTPRKAASMRKPLPKSPEKSGIDVTPQKVPLKMNDGPTPRSQRSAHTDGDTETVVSDRLSVMSFAFKGSDQVMPVKRMSNPTPKVNGIPSGRTTVTGNGGTTTNRSIPVRGQSTNPNAKFGHRLRPHEMSVYEGNDPERTIRPLSKTRRSLPPAMALQPVTNIPDNVHRGNDNALLNPPRTPMTQGRESVISDRFLAKLEPRRNVKGSTPPSMTIGEGKKVSAVTAKRLSLKAGGGTMSNGSPSGSGSLSPGLKNGNAGMEKVGAGSKKVGLAGRDLGGRI